MATAWVERRLAAILAADVVGYSHLVEQDEAGTLSALKNLRREVIDPLLAERDDKRQRVRIGRWGARGHRLRLLFDLERDPSREGCQETRSFGQEIARTRRRQSKPLDRNIAFGSLKPDIGCLRRFRHGKEQNGRDIANAQRSRRDWLCCGR